MKRIEIYVVLFGIIISLAYHSSCLESNADTVYALNSEIALLKSGIAEQKMMTELICEKTGISLSEYYTVWGLKSPLKEKLELQEKENARKED